MNAFAMLKPMKSKRLIVIRHGESTANIGWGVAERDAQLTQRGISQAYKAGEKLASMALPAERTMFVSSPLSRALQTALQCMHIAGFSTEALVVSAGVREKPDSVPSDLGRPVESLQLDFPHVSKQLHSLPNDWHSTAENESTADFKQRVKCMRTWLETLDADVVVLIAHHGFLYQLCNRSLDNCQIIDTHL